MAKNIYVIITALFAISLITILDPNVEQRVYALTQVTFTNANNNGINQCYYQSGTDRFYCASNAGSGGAILQRYNAQTGVQDVSFTLRPMFGNTTNPSTSVISLGGIVNSMFCDSFNQCYVTQQVGGTNPHSQIQKWLVTGNGSPISYLNYTVGTIETNGMDGVSAPSLSTTGGAIWIVVDSGTARILRTIDAGCNLCNNGHNIPLQDVFDFTLSPTSVSVAQIAHCLACGGNPSIGRVAVSYQNSGGGFVIDVVNIPTGAGAGICTSSLVNLATTNGGALFYNPANDKWVISDNSGDAVFVNRDACTVSQTVASSSITQNSNAPIKSFGINTVKSEYYAFYTVGGASQSSVSVMNLNSVTSLIQILASNSNAPPRYQAMAIGTSNHQVLVTDSSQTGIIFYIDGQSGGGGGGGGGGGSGSCTPSSCFVGDTDCNLPQNVNLLMCQIARNGGSFNGVTGTGQLFNQSASNIACQIGLFKCTQIGNNFIPNNTDVKTNGLGYLIAVLGLGVLISIFWVASDHDLRNIPTFVWFVAVLGFLGAMVALQWLDPTFFIVAIISLVALGVAKAKSVFGDF